jgi:hypothetical protein
MAKRIVREIIERQYEETDEDGADETDPSPRLVLELIERQYAGYNEATDDL